MRMIVGGGLAGAMVEVGGATKTGRIVAAGSGVTDDGGTAGWGRMTEGPLARFVRVADAGCISEGPTETGGSVKTRGGSAMVAAATGKVAIWLVTGLGVGFAAWAVMESGPASTVCALFVPGAGTATDGGHAGNDGSTAGGTIVAEFVGVVGVVGLRTGKGLAVTGTVSRRISNWLVMEIPLGVPFTPPVMAK